MWQTQFIEHVSKYLARTKKKNPHFSLRAFAQKCQISPGTLSDILLKKRNVSHKIALKILPYIGLTPSQQSSILELIHDSLQNQRRAINSHQLQLIETWHAFAILNLFELKSQPKSDIDISKRLGIPLLVVKKNIQNLITLGLLIIEKDKISSTGKHWKSTDEIPSASVYAAHLDGLKIAKKALEKIPLEHRDFTSIIFPGNPKNLKAIKLTIRKFLEKVAKIAGQGEPTSVYKINVQLFPLDQWDHRQ